MRKRLLSISSDVSQALAPLLCVYLSESWLDSLMSCGALSETVMLCSLPVGLTFATACGWLFYNARLTKFQKGLASALMSLAVCLLVLHLHVEAIEAVSPEKEPGAFFARYFFG